MKHNLIQEKTFLFAIEIIKLTGTLRKENEFVIANQLLRSGTSIGANVEEALGGASKRDFISKITIALKESRETNYWLRLLQAVRPTLDLNQLMSESNQILRILSKIALTSKSNLQNSVRSKTDQT